MKKSLTLEYWEDDGWYVGRLKEVPGVISQGETLAELEENIKDAYQLLLEDEKDEKEKSGVMTKQIEVEA